MRDSVQEFSDDGMIVFETSTTSNRTDATDFSNNSTGTTSGARKTSLFLKPSEMSDDDTEELPRSDEGIESSGNEHDVVIFIQMELHPITRKHNQLPEVHSGLLLHFCFWPVFPNLSPRPCHPPVLTFYQCSGGVPVAGTTKMEQKRADPPLLSSIHNCSHRSSYPRWH